MPCSRPTCARPADVSGALESSRGPENHAEPPLGRLREPADSDRIGAQLRRHTCRRDGQPLRPEPHARAPCRRVHPQDHRQDAGHPLDDRAARPLGAGVRRGGSRVRHLSRRGGGGAGTAGTRTTQPRSAGRNGTQAGYADRTVRGPATGARHGVDHDCGTGFRRPELP